MMQLTRSITLNNQKSLARMCLLFSLLFSSAGLHASWDKQSIKKMVAEEAGRQNFSIPLALAVAEVESNFDPYARSHVDARGVMQILPKTAEQDLGVRASSLYNPRVNIRAGVRFLMHLLSVYDGRVDIALSHYNGGSRVRQQDGSLKVIPATRGYVKKVLHKARQYGFDGVSIQQPVGPALRVAQRQVLDDFERGDPLLRARAEGFHYAEGSHYAEQNEMHRGLANQTLNAIKAGQADSKAEVINKLKNLVIYNQNRVLKENTYGTAPYRSNTSGRQERQMELANEW